MDQVEFQALDMEAPFFPRSLLPMTPVWPRLRLRSSRASVWWSRFRGSQCIGVAGGRHGIAFALEAAGVGKGNRVLLPAYHCASMVEPALWLGANVSFYHLHRDLAANVEDLKRRLEEGAEAVILTHYFGFPQAADAIRKRCEEQGAILIEDCAHALFGNCGNGLPGSVGHLSVASTRKFCPGRDGGMVCRNGVGSATWPALRASGTRKELRVLYRVVAEMLGHRFRREGRQERSAPCPDSQTSGNNANLREAPAELDVRHQGSALRWFSPSEAGSRMTLTANALFRFADIDRIAAARRGNYRFMLERCSVLGRATPLYPDLPDGVVPYAFPLFLRYPAEDFRQLKYRGVPIWRWDELAVSDCEVSQSYRHALIQLPCHENLRPGDREWIAGSLREVLL